MKKAIILLVTLLSVNLCFTQEKEVHITYTNKKEVILNGNKINKKTTIKAIKENLGTPILYKEYPSGKVKYHYPDLGISVEFTNDKLSFIGANFNWDGDKAFPETTFVGLLEIGSIKFDKNSNNSTLSEVKIVEIKCLFPSMCMTDPNKEKNSIIIGFKDNKLTQIGFGFK
jgi:hypothetical protein